MPKARTTLVIDPFRVGVSLAENQICGGVEDTFLTNCEITTEELTPEGYVIEVKEFMEAVRSAFRDRMYKASCEELAAGVVHVVARMVGIRLVEMTAQVKNLTGRVTIFWKQGMEIPAFPRPATKAEELESRHRPTYREERRASAC